MKKKIIAAAVAGGLLVGAGLVTSIVSSPDTASAQEDAAAEAEEKGRHHRGMEVLSEALEGLVSDGTLTQTQADAVIAAVQEEAEERIAAHKAQRELIESFLADDVIDSDELAQLPDDHPFNNPDSRFGDAAADGQLTKEEIHEAFPHPRRDFFKRGARLGALLDDGGIDQAEYDEVMSNLPDDHWLKDINVTDELGDGLITPDELREMWQDIRASRDNA